MGQVRKVIHECPITKHYGNVSLSGVIPVIESLLGGGPKVILATVEPFALGASWCHFLAESSELSSLLGVFAQSHKEGGKHIAIMFSVLRLCFLGGFHVEEGVGLTLKLTQSAP